MPSTTIHIPAELLAVVDARAAAHGLSRNRFILQAIQKCVEADDSWDPEFLGRLRRPRSRSEIDAVSEMMEAIGQARSSKAPPEL